MRQEHFYFIPISINNTNDFQRLRDDPCGEKHTKNKSEIIHIFLPFK